MLDSAITRLPHVTMSATAPPSLTRTAVCDVHEHGVAVRVALRTLLCIFFLFSSARAVSERTHPPRGEKHLPLQRCTGLNNTFYAFPLYATLLPHVQHTYPLQPRTAMLSNTTPTSRKESHTRTSLSATRCVTSCVTCSAKVRRSYFHIKISYSVISKNS